MIDISITVKEHIKDILEVEEQCFNIKWSEESFIEDICNNERAYYWSAIYDNKVIGYAGIWAVLDEGQIMNIAVHPQYRRKGIANMLINQFIKLAENKKLNTLTLEVRKSNLGAIALYKKNGFMECGIRKAYYSDNREDAILLVKDCKSDVL